MEIEIFTLCDYSTEMQGKLTIVGTFDVLWAKKMPVVHPSLSVAARIRLDNEEAGDHSFKIEFKDENGKDFLKTIEGKLGTKPADIGHSTINMAINIGQLKLETYGKKSINFYIDNDWKKSLRLVTMKPK